MVSFWRRPVETVLLPGCTDDALGIDTNAGSGPVLLCIFVLSVDIGKTGLDCVQFVAADAPVQDFEAAGGGIELPAALLARKRDRKWKFIDAKNSTALLSLSSLIECLAL